MRSSPAGWRSGLVGLGRRIRLRVLTEQARSDVRTVLCERPRDPGLADPVQVADRPIQLLQRVLGGAAVELLVLARAVGHPTRATTRRAAAAAATAGAPAAGPRLGRCHRLPPARGLGRLGRAFGGVEILVVVLV